MTRDVLAELARSQRARQPEPVAEAPQTRPEQPEQAASGQAHSKPGDKPAVKRNTRVIPFSLDDIIDASEGN